MLPFTLSYDVVGKSRQQRSSSIREFRLRLNLLQFQLISHHQSTATRPGLSVYRQCSTGFGSKDQSVNASILSSSKYTVYKRNGHPTPRCNKSCYRVLAISR